MKLGDWLISHPITWEWPLFRVINEGFRKKYSCIDAAGNAECLTFYVLVIIGTILGILITPKGSLILIGGLILAVYVLTSLCGFLYICSDEEELNGYDFLDIVTEEGTITLNSADLFIELFQKLALGLMLGALIAAAL
jgi:hypothetical protein